MIDNDFLWRGNEHPHDMSNDHERGYDNISGITCALVSLSARCVLYVISMAEGLLGGQKLEVTIKLGRFFNMCEGRLYNDSF